MPTSKTPAAKGDAKPKAAKAPAKKIEAKPSAKPVVKTAAKAAPKKIDVATGGKVKVTQVVGSIGRRHDQEATLIGLGLNKRHRSRVLVDTPEVRGMIYKVRHLVKAEKVS